MCGICGIVYFNQRPVQETIIKKMMDRMKHRGPDDEGVYIYQNLGFGHKRLSIIDLSAAGHQPMFSHDKRYCIVYNGEIYNYLELREQLASNYNFRTRTDTETLLAGYQKWGRDCLHYFNGMFAFAIYDKYTREIFCARDRFGIKPFYYFRNQESLIFASEIRPLLAVLGNNVDPDLQAIFDFLIYNRTDHTEETFFKGVKQLKHGHCLRINGSKVVIERWYNLADQLNKPFRDPEEFKEVLTSSIGLRLRSDVPVGVCLSGGLDSSSIVSTLINNFKRVDLKSFSAVYGKNIFGDESEYINKYAPVLKNMYYAYPTETTLLDDFDSFIVAHSEPLPSSSTYAQFKTMELAKEHVGVTLDGQGADEQLAGYHYFFGYLFKDLFHRLSWLKLVREIFSYIHKHHSIFALKSAIYLMLPKNLMAKTRFRTFQYLQPEFFLKFCDSSFVPSMLYQSSSLKNSLINHFEYKLEHLLKREDRNSMWFSLEARVPFLDHRLVERTLSLNSAQIIGDGQTKRILREAMRGIMPETIRIRRDKIGFETPEDDWFRTKKLEEYTWDLITSESFKHRNFFDTEKVKSLFAKHLRGEINIGQHIWKWTHLEAWFRRFVDCP